MISNHSSWHFDKLEKQLSDQCQIYHQKLWYWVRHKIRWKRNCLFEIASFEIKVKNGISETFRSRISQKRTTSLFTVASRNRVNEDHIKFMRCGHFLGGQKKQSGSGRLDIYSLQKKWNRVYNVVKCFNWDKDDWIPIKATDLSCSSEITGLSKSRFGILEFGKKCLSFKPR